MYNLWLRGGFIRPDRALGSTVQQEKGVKRARKNKLRRLVTRSGLRLPVWHLATLLIGL